MLRKHRPGVAELLSARPARLVATLALAGLATLAAAGCSSDPELEDDALVESGLIEVDAEPTPIFDPSDPNEMSGVTTNRSAIKAGQCFNEYRFFDAADFKQHVTTIVTCDGPHDHEAYFRTDFPAGEEAGYPDEEELERWADTTCLGEFEAFVGLEYVLSQLEIGSIVPTYEGWTDDGDRAVICYVVPDRGGRLLGPVAGSGL